ncbi:hypothetical protein JG688_00009688 [Phytophthora aleatoria]|uniref:Uncharacterized protein n=1 Tax=Phytophthora aleatoria TaxID=2496075 RepID=A0A8J5IX05_9STRA|nr:hypothetical protein JG688_00009688 [Phytophthora aleatoria]
MRRNQSFERQQFAETRLPKRGRRQYYQAAVERGEVTPPPVTQTLLCAFLQQNAARSGSAVEDTSSTSSDKRQRLIREYFDNVFSEDELEELERLLV